MLSFTLSGNISMDNHQWRLSQAYTYAFHISIHISITLIPYHLYSYCMSIFFGTYSMSLAYPLSILFLYSYFYTLHIPILVMCSSFTLVICLFNVPILFFWLHIMSLVYVFFIFRFYDLVHSMYYYIYHFLSCTYIMSPSM